MQLLLNRKHSKGFTLIEILLVVAILSVLSVVVYVALNPAGRLADTRNARRFGDVNNILTAINECIVDKDGIIADCGLSTSMAETELGTCTATNDSCTTSTLSNACTDFSTELAAYLKSIPQDPLNTNAVNTGYTIAVDDNNLVTVKACRAENSQTIQVSR